MKLVLLALAIIGYCFDINSGCCCKKKNKTISSGGGPGKPTTSKTDRFDAEIIVRPDRVTIKPVGNTEIKLFTANKVDLNKIKLVNDRFSKLTTVYKFDYSKMVKNAKITVDNEIKKKPYLIAIVSLEGDESSKYILIVSKDDGDMSNLFYDLNITEVSLLASNGITSIQDIFRECRHLTVCNINIDTSMVINTRGVFNGCSSLTSLPDVSKWDTSNVTNMCFMFSECKKLKSLPDISKWNTSSVTSIIYMFSECESLTSLPDVSKWDTSNVTDMSGVFNGCSSLTSLPDVSKWDTSNVTNMCFMFSRCSSLSSLPDISKWNTSRVTNIVYMFDECSSLNNSNIPDKFKSKLLV